MAQDITEKEKARKEKERTRIERQFEEVKDYRDLLEAPDLDEEVLALHERPHKTMLKALSRNEHDVGITERLGAGIFDEDGDEADTLPPPTDVQLDPKSAPTDADTFPPPTDVQLDPKPAPAEAAALPRCSEHGVSPAPAGRGRAHRASRAPRRGTSGRSW